MSIGLVVIVLVLRRDSLVGGGVGRGGGADLGTRFHLSFADRAYIGGKEERTE